MRSIDADAFKKYIDAQEGRPFIGCTVGEAMKILIDEQPTVQPEPAIPLSWIENEIKWLKSLDDTFSEITALQISAMVKKWRDEQNEVD